jgi:AcrR family transcriptional regulator
MAGRVGRKDEILAAFIRHVAERGYDQTNLSDIAGELGMSKGTIVHHFGTKAQMLRDLEESYMNRRRAEVELIWDRLQSPAERIAAIIYATVFYQVEDRDATVATQREVIQLAGDPQMQEIRGIRAEVQKIVRDEIAAGVSQGMFRPVNVDFVTMQIFGAAQWMWTWFDPTGRDTPQKVGAAMVDLTLGGLLADRFALPQLADPKGRIPRVVQDCIEAARSSAAKPT